MSQPRGITLLHYAKNSSLVQLLAHKHLPPSFHYSTAATTPATAARIPPALRARSAALLVLLAEAADPVEVALLLVDSSVDAESVDVAVSDAVVVAGALTGLLVELGYWLA